MSPVSSPTTRARMRAGAGLLMAAVGLGVAALTPRMFTDADPEAATWWVVAALLGGVVALLVVVAGNLLGPRRLDRMRSLARAGVLVGCVVAAGFVLGLALVADDLVRDQALPLAPLGLSGAVIAVLLGFITVRLDNQE